MQLQDIPESIFIDGIFAFFNARDAQILRWMMTRHLKMVWVVQPNWGRLLTNDITHLRQNTRLAMLSFFKCNPKQEPIVLSDVKSVYESDVPTDTHHSFTQSMELGFYPSRVLHRGVCWSTNQCINWHDTLHNTHTKRRFEWLTLPPWDLSLQHMYSLWLPSEHSYVPPYVISLVGEPEDTVCLTNFKCLYRFSMNTSQDEATEDYEELTLGGRFESSITHMQLLHYCHPYLVVSGQPLWYNASSHYKCFGVWNVEKRDSLFAQLRTSGANFSSSARAQCDLPENPDFINYECLHMTPCGRWIHWKHHHTLFKLFIPAKQITCTMAFQPFTTGRVTRIVVCAVKDWIGVYYDDESVWKVFRLTLGRLPYVSTQHHNCNYEPIHVFANQHKTQLQFFPFRRCIQFSRKIGTKIVVSTHHYA